MRAAQEPGSGRGYEDEMILFSAPNEEIHNLWGLCGRGGGVVFENVCSYTEKTDFPLTLTIHKQGINLPMLLF